MSFSMEKCKICDGDVSRYPDDKGWDLHTCVNCGRYRASMLDLISEKKRDPDAETKLRYWLSGHSGPEDPVLDDQTVEKLLAKPLPGPKEVADNLVRLIASRSSILSHRVKLVESEDSFTIGAKSPHSFKFLLSYVVEQGWALDDSSNTEVFVVLTMKGWEYYDELKRGHADSRKAFMAMKFGDKQLDRVFQDVLKPAMKQVGFDLFSLAERERWKAGLIDDRMRVEIQSSAIVLADLTHQNAGAYWEAGYAEGLGKPVIYTCKKEVFDREKTHFDTNHHLTIVWDPEKHDEAMEDLKATVRATLPDLASGVDLSTGEPS